MQLFPKQSLGGLASLLWAASFTSLVNAGIYVNDDTLLCPAGNVTKDNKCEVVNEYPRMRNGNHDVLFENNNYVINWEGAKPDHNVSIAWMYGSGPTGNDRWPWMVAVDDIRWVQNVSAGPNGNGHWTFDPTKILDKGFPNKYTNKTSTEVRGTILGGRVFNAIRIWQPTVKDDDDADGSNYFALMPEGGKTIMEFEYKRGHEAEKKVVDKWRLGVGIAVGLGVPILMLVSFILGGFLQKRKNKKAPMVSKKRTSDAS